MEYEINKCYCPTPPSLLDFNVCPPSEDILKRKGPKVSVDLIFSRVDNLLFNTNEEGT